MERKVFRYTGWEIVGKLGKGSYGTVYKISRNLGKSQEYAALKVLSIPKEEDLNDLRQSGYDQESLTETFKQQKQEIVREYDLSQKLGGNTNIVNVHDVTCVQHDDDLGWDIFIRMELLTPLTQIVEKSTIREYQVIKLGKDLCRALSLCEKNNILHRDIKPQNIFVSPNADYKLGDFGIAKIAENTSSGTKAGTFKFMAPEIYNNMPYGSKSDLYSLGLVMYWLLNEKCAPFMPLPPAKKTASDENLARQKRFAGEPLPLPANGSKELKAIVCKACAFRPEDRFSDAQEMLKALETLYVPEETIAIPPPKVEPISFQADSTDSTPRHDDNEADHPGKDSQSSSDDPTRGARRPGEISQEEGDSPEGKGGKGEERKKRQKKLSFPILLIMMCLFVGLILLVRYIIQKDLEGIYTVTLTAVSDSKVYDGTPLKNTTIMSSRLASDDHTMTADYVVFDNQGNELEGDPINVGVYSKRIQNIQIWDGKKEITKQYQITTIDGYLTITAPETIVTPSPEPTDLRLMGPFSSGRFYFMNGASVQIPEGFSDTNTSGDYRSANNTDGYVYVFKNSEYDMTITLSEDYVSTYRDTGKYGESDYELLSTLREELIAVRGTPSWRSLFPEYFKLTGYLGKSIYYTYGVIDNDVLYIIDFFYPEKNRQYCDRIVEVTEESFSGSIGQQANTSITTSKPSAKDLDEINANVVYPASESYYLDAYETKFVQSQSGNGAVYFFNDPDSKKDVMRNGNYQAVYNGTEATVIARSPSGWSCVIFPSMNCAGWINSNYLVSK